MFLNISFFFLYFPPGSHQEQEVTAEPLIELLRLPLSRIGKYHYLFRVRNCVSGLCSLQFVRIG